MQYTEISDSEVTWATTIQWSKQQQAAYIGNNHGSIYKLVNDELKTLVSFFKAPITRFRSIEGQVIVQTPSQPVCLLHNKGLIPIEASQGSVFSNVDKGRVAIWDPETKEITVQTLEGEIEKRQKQEKRPWGLVLDGDELTVSDTWGHELQITSAGLIKTLWDWKKDEKNIVDDDEKSGVFLGVAGDYTVLQDGLYNKDWKRVFEFEKPPVAWAAIGSRVAWTYISEIEIKWCQDNPKTHTVVVHDVETENRQSVDLPNTVIQGVGGMAFCGDRLLVGGNKLVWVTPEPVDS